MKRFIRWKYLLPRLLTVALVVLLADLVAGPVVRRLIIAHGQSKVGAKVEIDRASASLAATQLTLDGIHVANPYAPMRNLVEADRLELDFETAGLLHKKLIARSGRLRGLQFGTMRKTSGALSAEASEQRDAKPTSDDEASKRAEAWLADLDKRFSLDLVAEFESVQLAERLCRRWPDRCNALQKRAASLLRQASQLQAAIKTAEANPLRNTEFLRDVPNRVEELNAALAELHAEIAALPEATEDDRDAIASAREHDEQLIRERLNIEPIDPSALSAYLLRNQLDGPLGELVGWIRWMRETVPAGDGPQSGLARGQDVVPAGCQPLPDFLVRSLELQGTARLLGQPIELSGTLTDITSDPKIHGRPTRLELSTSGSLPLRLKATIDRTGDVPRDQLLVDCRGLLLPKIRLGRGERLGLSVAPSTAFVNVSLNLEGDQLTGDVQMVQKSAQITPEVGGQLAAWQLDGPLYDSLVRLNSIATHVSLGGTLDNPQYEIWSNLGPATYEALELAIVRATQLKAEALIADSDKRIESQLATAEQFVADRTAGLLPQLDAPERQLEQLADDFSGERGLSWKHLGRRLPADSLFR